MLYLIVAVLIIALVPVIVFKILAWAFKLAWSLCRLSANLFVLTAVFLKELAWTT